MSANAQIIEDFLEDVNTYLETPGSDKPQASATMTRRYGKAWGSLLRSALDIPR